MNHPWIAGMALLLAFLSPATGFAATAGQEGKHLFILSGQSNMGALDPNLSFTPLLEATFGKDNVVVIKDAQGGQPIRRWYKGWKPEWGSNDKFKLGDLYDRLMQKVLPVAKREKFATVTFVWMQGERDANGKHGNVYRECLEGLLRQLSADLGREDLQFVIGRLSDHGMELPDWRLVREVQVAVAESSPRGAWVDTDDLNDGVNRKGIDVRNDLHLSVKGYAEFGRRLAEKAIELIRKNGGSDAGDARKLLRPTAAQNPAVGKPPPFFAFEDSMQRGDRTPSNAGKAALLRELGYDGISASAASARDLSFNSDDEVAAVEKEGLRVFNVYVVLSLDSAHSAPDPRLKEMIHRLAGHRSALWITIKELKLNGEQLKPSAPEGDAVAVPFLRGLADLGQSQGVDIAIYHHIGHWTERPEDTVRLTKKIDRPNVGGTFNLCHWLKAVGDVDPAPMLKEAVPYLSFVSINGADRGDTKAMDWNRIVQPLGRGTYDVGALLQTLRELGYTKPIGFQAYAIKGEPRDILRETMAAWRKLHARSAELMQIKQ